MKKISRLLFAVTVTGTLGLPNLQAQESDMDDRMVRFGLMGTPNFGWVKPNIGEFNDNRLRPRFGFGYGLMMDYKFTPSSNYLFSTGINLTTNGGGLMEAWDSTVLVPGVDTTVYFGRLDRTYRLQYVNIPLLLKMRTNEIGYMTYFAAVGIDLGIRTRAFANDDYTWANDIGPSDREDVNIQNRIGLFRMAINLTAGGEFNLTGNTNFYMGIGWHNGFTNLFRNTPENRIIIPNDDGNPKLDDNGFSVLGKNKKAVTNYISLDLGIFF